MGLLLVRWPAPRGAALGRPASLALAAAVASAGQPPSPPTHRLERLGVDVLVLAEVVMTVGDVELVAAITRGSAESLGLKAGDSVKAVIKATEVPIDKP